MTSCCIHSPTGTIRKPCRLVLFRLFPSGWFPFLRVIHQRTRLWHMYKDQRHNIENVSLEPRALTKMQSSEHSLEGSAGTVSLINLRIHAGFNSSLGCTPTSTGSSPYAPTAARNRGLS